MTFDEHVIPAEDEYEWVEAYLEAWAGNAFAERHPHHLDAPSTASGFIGGGTGGYWCTEDWEDQISGVAIKRIDAALQDLPRNEQVAVCYFHGQATAVFRMREPIRVVYLRARQKIGLKLRAEGLG